MKVCFVYYMYLEIIKQHHYLHYKWEQKKELFDKILGTDLESSRNVIKSNNNKLSAIYLLTLGYVKDLKHEMKLDSEFDDNMIVYQED